MDSVGKGKGGMIWENGIITDRLPKGSLPISSASSLEWPPKWYRKCWESEGFVNDDIQWHSMNSIQWWHSSHKEDVRGGAAVQDGLKSSNLRSCDSEHTNLRHKILRLQIKSYGSNYWKNLLNWTLSFFNIPFSSW